MNHRPFIDIYCVQDIAVDDEYTVICGMMEHGV